MTEAGNTKAKGQNLTLDDLSARSYEQLDELYRTGQVPRDFSNLESHPKGRMLAIRLVDKTPAAAALRAFSKMDLFPWDGKSMSSTGKQSGEGINRIKLGASMEWFPFKTRVEKSVVDGEDTIFLDYDQPGNPWFVKMIRDELREVSPGLYLGPAMLKTGPNKASNVVWFALDATG